MFDMRNPPQREAFLGFVRALEAGMQVISDPVAVKGFIAEITTAQAAHDAARAEAVTQQIEAGKRCDAARAAETSATKAQSKLQSQKTANETALKASRDSLAVDVKKLGTDRDTLTQDQGKLAADQSNLADVRLTLETAQRALGERAARLKSSEDKLAEDRAAFEAEKVKHRAWQADNESALAAARKIIGA